ncbi:MAG TPA: quinone oxidoreductase [Myxococcota bacterium]|nr:quinone oxidoreductase [Myxococcota bacterium]
MGHAIFVRETGGPDVLRFESHDPGAPGKDQVRIRVRACGVNFIDVYFRTGLYPRPLPFVAGLEGAGEVEAVGEGVTEFRPGDRVAWASAPGSYAGATVAPADRLVRVPQGVSDEVAGAVMLQGMTAHYLSHAVRTPQQGDTALVHAAAGGTGLLLVQMLKRAGVHVLGTCGSAEKEALVREAGADHVIRYRERDVASEVRRLTEGRGVHVAYDSVGQSTFEGSLRSLRPRGLLVLFGQSSGAVPPLELRRLGELGSLYVTRPSLAHYTADREELLQRGGEVLHAIESGALRVRIGARFPLREARAAHEALESRSTTGKVLLVP